MTRLLTCSLIVLGSLIRCSTNSMFYPFYSHPPSLPSSYAPQDNSNYHTLVNLVPSAHCASALSSSACSTRAVSGTTPTWVQWTDGQLCWISLGWVRLVEYCPRTLINSPVSLLSPQDSHHHARNFFYSIFSSSLFRLLSRLLRTKPRTRAR
jgi:hypothetical protein